MHSYTIFSLITSFLAFLSSSFAAPIDHAYQPAVHNETTTSIDKRQFQIIVEAAEIINAASKVLEALETVIDLVDGEIADAEGQFTQNLVSSLMAQYPTVSPASQTHLRQ
jgi:hypothetical protein